jgi:hypothetical protein
MLKRYNFLFVFIFCLLAGFYSCKRNKQSAAEEKNPHHKPRPESPIVKSIKKYGISARTGTDTLLQVEEFDEKGYKIRFIKYDAGGGGMEYETQYTNNSDGKPVRTVTKYADGSVDTEENEYNSDGKVTSTKWQRSDGTSGKHEYKFDDNGTIIQWDWFEKDHFVMSRLYPTTYNDEGKPLESFYKETTNNRDTTTVNHYQYAYDEKNRLVRKLSMENDLPLALEEYIYDTLGNKIIEIFYEPDSLSSGTLVLGHKQLNVYNEYGELTQYKTAMGKGDLELTVSNKYDDFGHLIETIYDYAPGFYRKERIVYEYWKQ